VLGGQEEVNSDQWVEKPVADHRPLYYPSFVYPASLCKNSSSWFFNWKTGVRLCSHFATKKTAL